MGEPRNGIDVAVPIGTPVLASDDRRVIFTDAIPDRDGCGVIIDHGYGQTIYWHLSKVIANFGQVVKGGDLIGLSGDTGFATGPHLHFGLKLYNPQGENIRGYVNPEPYFEEKEPVISSPSYENKYHLVMPGDTLWGLAVKYYNNGTLWKKIYDANRDKIKNPQFIYPLQRLKIP